MSRKTFMDHIVKAARETQPQPVWTRGAPRARMIARRLAQQPKKIASAR